MLFRSHQGEEKKEKVIEDILSNISFRGAKLWILVVIGFHLVDERIYIWKHQPIFILHVFLYFGYIFVEIVDYSLRKFVRYFALVRIYYSVEVFSDIR